MSRAVFKSHKMCCSERYRTNISRGSSLGEYGILLGILVVFSIGALTLLGQSTFDLFDGTSKTTQTSSVNKYLNMDFGTGAGGGGTSGGAPGTLSHDETSGQTVLNMADLGPVPVNATSTEGQMAQSTRKTLTTAQELSALAAQTKNSTARAWIEALARKAYYMGGVMGTQAPEAALLGLHVQPHDGTYNQSTATTDMYNLQLEMDALMNDDPRRASVPPDLLAKVLPLAQEAFELAQPMADDARAVLSKLGQPTDQKFELNAYPQWMVNLASGALTGTQETVTQKTYMDLMPYDQLVATAGGLVNTQPSSTIGASTVNTLEDGTQLDKTANSLP